MKNNIHLHIFALLILIVSSCARSTILYQTPTYSKKDIIAIAQKYGWPEDAVKGPDSTKVYSEEQLNEFFIATRLQSILLHNDPKKDIISLANGIQQALENKIIEPSNILMTYVKNANKEITNRQMYLALQQSFTGSPNELDNDPQKDTIIVYRNLGTGKYDRYYCFLLNPINY